MKGKRVKNAYFFQPVDGHQDLMSESTMENLTFQDMAEIYTPNGKSCTNGKLWLYAVPWERTYGALHESAVICHDSTV